MTKKSLERNLRLYPFYRAFSYDMLFIWTISIMYLTWKGLSYSQTIFLDAIFMITAFVFQIPMTKFINKFGRGLSIRISGLLCVGFSVLFLLGNSLFIFVIAYALYGLSVAIKNVCDPEILALSLKKLGRAKEYSKIEGRGTFTYYIIESCAAIASGYLFAYVNPYAPIVGTLIGTIILAVLGFLLKDPKDGELLEELKIEEKPIAESKNKTRASVKSTKVVGITLAEVDKFNSDSLNLSSETKAKKKDKGTPYKMLLKDKFIISMIVFCFCYYGIMSVYSTLAKVYYQDIGTRAWMFGYIFFIFKIITAVCAKFQFKYELKRGVRSLVIFAVLTIVSFGLNGIMATISSEAVISIIVITIMFIVQNAIRAPYRIFVKNYINISSKKEDLTKVLTLYNMAEYLGYSFITLLVSLIMSLTNNSFAMTNIVITAVIAMPMLISIIIFIKELVKKYTVKNTIIREDMKDDL